MQALDNVASVCYTGYRSQGNEIKLKSFKLYHSFLEAYINNSKYKYMSVIYCEKCNKYIDTDYDVDHECE